MHSTSILQSCKTVSGFGDFIHFKLNSLKYMPPINPPLLLAREFGPGLSKVLGEIFKRSCTKVTSLACKVSSQEDG